MLETLGKSKKKGELRLGHIGECKCLGRTLRRGERVKDTSAVAAWVAGL
jgi:hypothetical protein